MSLRRRTIATDGFCRKIDFTNPYDRQERRTEAFC